MKKLIAVLLLFSAFYGAQAQQRPYSTVDTYFTGTNYELSVYRVYGRKDGKTMLILGGIQGDEPGGFLSADLYAGLQLERGNLIIVPRANFKSVILYDRGPDGDMNRRFQESKESIEMDKVVSVVKKLMGQADVFLNLHDGWGFHNPKDIDATRNHRKFGESVITDADTFTCTNGRVLDLKGPATKVLEETNKKIDSDDYKLHYFDTDTSDPRTQFADMRKTATYYALRTYCMPAFAIETSKNLPSNDLKVLYHTYAVNEFMKLYGIIPEVPAVTIHKPVMQYAVIMVNGEPVRVDRGQSLFVRPGDVCQIVHVESNYDRGLSADIVGYGTLNDMNTKYAIRNNAVIQFRKDSQRIGSINVNVSMDAPLYASANTAPVITAVPAEIVRVPASAPAEKPQTAAPVIASVPAAAPQETPVKAEPVKTQKPAPAEVVILPAPAEKPAEAVKQPEPAKAQKTEVAVVKPAPAETKPVIAETKQSEPPVKGYVFTLRQNGILISIADGETLKVKKGDKVIFIAIFKDGENMNLPINLKGYYSPTDPLNSGDDRNYIIKMLPAKFMAKYAENDAKTVYPVIVKQDDKEIAKMHVEIQ